MNMTKNWQWNEFYSLVLGPCYMFEFTKNVSAAERGELPIKYDLLYILVYVGYFMTFFTQCESKLYQTSENVYTRAGC